MNKKMTEADVQTLKECPEGWFHSDKLFPRVKNAYYRLQRLEKFDLVESKSEGPDIYQIERYWKKK